MAFPDDYFIEVVNRYPYPLSKKPACSSQRITFPRFLETSVSLPLPYSCERLNWLQNEHYSPASTQNIFRLTKFQSPLNQFNQD